MLNTNTVTITSPLFPGQRFYMDALVEQKEPKKQPKLKKDGTPKKTRCNKKKGVKSEVYTITPQDMREIVHYFEKKEKWLYYLIFIVSCNMARRIGDTIGGDTNEYLPNGLLWEHFYNPATGKFRKDLLEINEQKTDKLANPHINQTVKNAIEKYIEKTGVNPAENNYRNPVFLQTTGNYKGRVVSYNGYRLGLKGAAENVGISENICTHSPRKTFGMINRMIHPGDRDSMELLQSIYNHSSTKITKRYIGITKKQIDDYFDDFGNFFEDYVLGDKTYTEIAETPVVNIDVNDLRDVIKMAYKAGADNAGATDPAVHLEAMSNILTMIEELQK